MKSNKIDELCPQCGKQVIFKSVGDDFRSFDFDGTIHRCRTEQKPIGQAVTGHIIEMVKLKECRLTLFLSDGLMLEVSSSLNDQRVALNLALITPDGIIEEKGRPLRAILSDLSKDA